MSTGRTRRSPGAEAAVRLVLDDPAAIADEVTRLAVTLPLDYGDTLADITAISEAIIRSALADPFYETTANRWRPLIPGWVRVQSTSGATITLLIRLKILVHTGRYARCDNSTTCNGGKLQPVYALDVIGVRDLLSAGAAPAETA